jgi:hypothetical protein
VLHSTIDYSRQRSFRQWEENIIGADIVYIHFRFSYASAACSDITIRYVARWLLCNAILFTVDIFPVSYYMHPNSSFFFFHSHFIYLLFLFTIISVLFPWYIILYRILYMYTRITFPITSQLNIFLHNCKDTCLEIMQISFHNLYIFHFVYII